MKIPPLDVALGTRFEVPRRPPSLNTRMIMWLQVSTAAVQNFSM